MRTHWAVKVGFVLLLVATVVTVGIALTHENAPYISTYERPR